MKASLLPKIFPSRAIIPIEPNGVITVSILIPPTFLSLGRTAAVVPPDCGLCSCLFSSNRLAELTKRTGFFTGAFAS